MTILGREVADGKNNPFNSVGINQFSRILFYMVLKKIIIICLLFFFSISNLCIAKITYIVRWTISQWVPNIYPIKTDEYGRVDYNEYPINHGHYESRILTKEFSTKEEAKEFIDNAPIDIKDTIIMRERCY